MKTKKITSYGQESRPSNRGTWNDASNMDEYGPPFDGSTVSIIIDARCLNYFVWFESKHTSDIKDHLRHHNVKSALVLEFTTTITPDDRNQRPAYWACFDYANGHKGGRRYVHIFKTRKEARKLRQEVPDIVFPPIPVWLVTK